MGGDFLKQPTKRTLNEQPQGSTLTHANLQGSLLQLGAILGHAHTAGDLEQQQPPAANDDTRIRKKCNGRAETQFQHGGSRKPSGSIGAAIAERELGAHAAKAKERSGGTTGKQCDPRIPYRGEKEGSIQGRRWTRSPLRGSTRTTWAMQRGGEERKEKTRGGRRCIV